MSPRAAVPWLLRAVLAGLFVYAAIGKLADPSAFAREIANYQLFPGIAQHVAVALPTTELVVALALFAPDRTWRRAGALGLAGLLAVLLVAVTSVVVRGVNVDCGCFGSGSGPVTWLTVLRNATLLACALYLVRLDESSSESGVGRGDGVREGEGDAGVGAAGDRAEPGRPGRSRVEP